MSEFALNWAGKVIFPYTPDPGALITVANQMPHIFEKFSCDITLAEHETVRFNYFINNVLPRIKEMSHVMIYIPSYYDFVRLRNYCKKESISFVQVCEYTKENKVSRARDMFYHGWRKFLFFTERYHFYHRYKIRGIHQIIFYQLPTYPQFYSELCNMIEVDEIGGIQSITVLYCKYDALQLAGVVGYEKAKTLLQSDKTTHMLYAGSYM